MEERYEKWQMYISNNYLGIVNYSNGDFSRYMYENNMMPNTFECTYRWNNGSQFNGWLKKDQNSAYQYERGTYKQPGKSIVEV